MVVDICDGKTEIVTSGTIITSPNYGNGREYPGPKDCSIAVRFEEGTSIHIEFLGVFEFEEKFCGEDGCVCFDSVQIRDGENDTSPLIITACDDKPEPMLSSGNVLLIKFASDDRDNYEGFSLQVNQTKRK